MNPDPDAPDPTDRTMARLELTEALDQSFPQWRSMIGQCRRDGRPLGWLDPATPLVGALMDDIDAAPDDKQPPLAPLPWRDDRSYLLLRHELAPECWIRALSRYPADVYPEAFVYTGPPAQELGEQRWPVLGIDDRPVLITDADGGNPRPLVLDSACLYDVTLDIEGGLEIWVRDDPRPPAAGLLP